MMYSTTRLGDFMMEAGSVNQAQTKRLSKFLRSLLQEAPISMMSPMRRQDGTTGSLAAVQPHHQLYSHSPISTLCEVSLSIQPTWLGTLRLSS
jgi:hypothetical protein